MKLAFPIFLLLFYSTCILSQCDLFHKLVVPIDAMGCCDTFEKSAYEIADHDTSKYLALYYTLICDKSLDQSMYDLLVDSMYVIESKMLSRGTESNAWKFCSRQRNEILEAKRRILQEGYQASSAAGNYQKASVYAKRMERAYPAWKDNKISRKWEELVLHNYEKYAENDVVKLIDFHKSWLLEDTSRVMLRTTPFNGYEYLVKKVSTEYSKREFRELLEASIAESHLVKTVVRGRPQYKLAFELGDTRFELLDYEISILYYPDTIVTDTLLVFDCYGNDPRGDEYIEFQQDTLKNVIPDLTNLELYRLRLRRSLLFGILDELEDR